MGKLFTIVLNHEEWTEVMIALYSLQYSRKVYENDDKKANKDKEIAENIQDQISLDLEKEKKSR